MTSAAIGFRRLCNAAFGTGPWRVAPFSVIASAREDETLHGVHRPESFAGVMRLETEHGFSYHPRTALLGQVQPPTGRDGPRYLPSGLVTSPDKKLFLLTDAGLAGRDGVIYCPRTRTAVAETVRCWTKGADAHPLLGAARFPSAQKLPGLSLSLATLDAEGFYHFLFEALPRLALVADQLKNIDHFLISGTRSSWIEAWLALAGVPGEKLRWLDPHSHFHCDQLLFTNRLINDCQPTPWLRQALHSVLPVPTRATGDLRLWISRADAHARHIRWEDQLLARLPGFVKVVLGGQPPAKQIELFSRAAVVAGAHGAGLANLIFSPPGVRLVEIFPDTRAIPLYGRVAQVCRGEASWIATSFSRADDLEKIVATISTFLR